MANYTVNPSNDVKQTDNTAITGTSTNLLSGAVVHAGATNQIGTNLSPYKRSSVHGSQIVEALSQNEKCLSAGTFAYQAAGVYIMRTVTTTISGTANTLLRSGGSYHSGRRPIHKRESVRTIRTATAIRANYWNEFSGSWDTDPTAANDMSLFETNGADEVAAPTQTKPGELVYRTGAPTPTQADYPAQQLW
jgi:hypothetical protein